MNAFLLSAGLGTRFRPVTDKIAKPAIPFLNVPLIGYVLYYLEQAGLKNLVLNTHHLPKTIESATSCLTHGRNYKISYSHEPHILGSGGGIKKAQSLIAANDDFIVCNADEIIIFNHGSGFAPLIELHKSRKALATLLTTDHPDAGKFMGGVWSDTNGKVTRLGGTHSDPGAKHFTGVYVFSPRVFDYMPAGGEFHIFKDCLNVALSKGETVLTFHDSDLKWFETGDEKNYIASTAQALKLLAGESWARDSSLEKVLSGKTVANETASANLRNILKRFHYDFASSDGLDAASLPHRWLCQGAQFNGSLNSDSYLLMGPESEIGRDVEIKGFAVLGAKAKFTQGVIENSVLGAGVHIHTITAARNELIP
jgi:mannose-1-phosphate guanylyltransferase